MTPSFTVLAARLAMAGAVTSLVLTPLHGLSRFNPALGHHDLDECCAAWWGRPGLEALRPLLDWSEPYTVYLSYGRVWILILAAAAFCAFAVRAVLRPVNRTQTWAWRAVLGGLSIQTAGLAGAFLTPWLDQFYAVVAIPGALLNLTGGTVLGISSLRRGPLPRFTAIVLSIGIVSDLVLSTLLYAGGAVVPILFAWAVAGRAAARAVTSPERTQMFVDSSDISTGNHRTSESGQERRAS